MSSELYKQDAFDELHVCIDFIGKLRTESKDKLRRQGVNSVAACYVLADMIEKLDEFIIERGYYQESDGSYTFDDEHIAKRDRAKELAYKEAFRCPRCDAWKARGMGDFCPDHDRTGFLEDEKEFAA